MRFFKKMALMDFISTIKPGLHQLVEVLCLFIQLEWCCVLMDGSNETEC